MPGSSSCRFSLSIIAGCSFFSSRFKVQGSRNFRTSYFCLLRLPTAYFCAGFRVQGSGYFSKNQIQNSKTKTKQTIKLKAGFWVPSSRHPISYLVLHETSYTLLHGCLHWFRVLCFAIRVQGQVNFSLCQLPTVKGHRNPSPFQINRFPCNKKAGSAMQSSSASASSNSKIAYHLLIMFMVKYCLLPLPTAYFCSGFRVPGTWVQSSMFNIQGAPNKPLTPSYFVFSSACIMKRATLCFMAAC